MKMLFKLIHLLAKAPDIILEESLLQLHHGIMFKNR